MLDTQMEVHKAHTLRVARLGRGEPLILLHGYPENLQLFSPLAKQLSAHYEVIAFDWPGMGYSEAWAGGATPEVKARQLLQLMEDWKIDKAHIAGMDMGAQPALAFAANHPERTLSVTIMNALIHGAVQTSWEIRLLRRFRFNKYLLEHFPGIVFGRALRTFLADRNNIDAPVRKDMWVAFKDRKVRDFIVRMCAGYGARLDRLPDLYRRITVPAFILWASEDKYFPLVQAQALQQLIPAAQLEIIANTGHWMVWENADTVAEKIHCFCRALSS